MTDARGRKTAVVIDLKKHGLLWKSFYAAHLAESRKKEPRESLQSVKRRLAFRRSDGL